MPRIFHFIPESDLAKFLSDVELRVPSLETQGFIHCSTAGQVTQIATGIMPGRNDLLLLEIDESKVIPKIIYENLEEGKKLFPHIYGPLNKDAIIRAHPFQWDDLTGYRFPEL